jgi:HK97 family phage portal protein
MGFLRKRANETEDRATTWVPWNVGEPDTHARRVTSAVALQHAAVYACVRLLADVIGSMPLHAYQTGSREQLDPQPSLLTAPAAYTTLGEWLGQVMTSVLTAGNAFGIVTDRDASERPTRIEIIDPARVAVSVPSRGGLVTYRLDGTEIDRDELWIFRGLLLPGMPIGISPIEYAAVAVSSGLYAQDYGAKWFQADSTPSAVLQSEHDLTREQAEQIAAMWKQTRHGRRGTAILSAGLKFAPVQVSPEESQFLKTQEFSVQQICRVYGVPPEMIGADSGNSLTYANVEQRDLSLLKYTVGPWITRLETAITALLPTGQHAKFNTGGLLRTDLASRYASYAIALDNGFLTIDEVRELEEREPLPADTTRKRRPLEGVA